jgi:hypothetical protein
MDPALAFLEQAHPLAGLFCISVVLALLIVCIYRFVSFQSVILRCRNAIIGDLLGFFVYSHSLRQIGRSMRSLVGSVGSYLWASLIPVGILTLLLVPIATALDLRYATRAFEPGEICLLRVQFDSIPSPKGVQLHLPQGIEPVAGPIPLHSDQALVWKVRIATEGHHVLVLKIHESGQAVPIPLLGVGANGIRIHSLTGAGAIDTIEFDYPPQTFTLYGRECHWTIPALSFLFLVTWGVARSIGIAF